MGRYILSLKELQEELEDFLYSLEGDYNPKQFVKAYNNIAKKNEFPERLKLKWIKTK